MTSLIADRYLLLSFFIDPISDINPQICKQFDAIINTDMRLQYRIRLALHHMVDNPACRLSIDERLGRLSAYEDVWTHYHEKDYYELSIEGDGVWDLSRGILAQVKDLTTLVCVQLPSAIRQTREKRWEFRDIEFDIAEICIDPDQDLLILVEEEPEYVVFSLTAGCLTQCGVFSYYNIHLRTLSEGKPHPQTHVPGKVRSYKTMRYSSLQIKVAGDYLAVAFEPYTWLFMQELAIWNWKTGDIHLVCCLNIITCALLIC